MKITTLTPLIFFLGPLHASEKIQIDSSKPCLILQQACSAKDVMTAESDRDQLDRSTTGSEFEEAYLGLRIVVSSLPHWHPNIVGNTGPVFLSGEEQALFDKGFVAYKAQLTSDILKKGIEAEWVEPGVIGIAKLTERHQIFLVKPSEITSHHPLNKWARDLWSSAQVRISVDPIARDLVYPGIALFDWRNNTIFVDNNFIHSAELNHGALLTIEHEIRHALFQAARDNKILYNNHLPLHILVRQGGDQFYLEEIFNHIVQLSDILKMEKMNSQISFALEKEQHRKMVDKYLQNALKIIDVFVMSKKSPAAELGFRPNFFEFSLKDFKTSLYVPEEHRVYFKAHPTQYLRDRLKDAKNFLQELQGVGLKDSDIEKMEGVFKKWDKKLGRETNFSLQGLVFPLKSCKTIFHLGLPSFVVGRP